MDNTLTSIFDIKVGQIKFLCVEIKSLNLQARHWIADAL